MTVAKVISFDAEGTLVTPQYSQVIWHEVIPALYARRWGKHPDEARLVVAAAYDEVGDQRREWYDINYWFKRFDLGDPAPILEGHRHQIACYDDVGDTLLELGQRYKLIVISNSSSEFLRHLMESIRGHFSHIFSALSDFGMLKSPELYRRVCELMEVSPSEMVHVGDSWEFDYVMPSKAGVRGVFLERQGLRGEGIGDLRQLLEWL